VKNQELIKKADLALSDLATAGRLNDEQADRFIRKLMDAPTLLRACRTVTMNAPQRKINKIGFGTRMLRAGVQGTALTEGERYKPTLEQVLLNTDEVIAQINLPYDVIEDNIERGNVAAGASSSPGGIHQTIVDMMAERCAVDLEELGLLGDSASGDPYLALTDGWLKRSTTNVVNASAAISKDVLKAGVIAMPDKYLRNRAQMRQIFSVDNETNLRDTYAARETALGDAMLQGTTPMYMHGSQVLAASAMPASGGLFCDPMNLIFGIWRNIQIEYDKDIETRVFKIVLTARVGFQIEETEAVVKYTNIA
jgi:HK97 family phage major capsid protein